MSVRVMAMVWEAFPHGGSPMLGMLALADWCNDEGGSLHPSIRAFARKCRLSEVQARRVLHDLIDDGFVAVIGNSAGGAPGTTRQYRICLERLRAIASDTRTPVTSDSPTALESDSRTTITADSPQAETALMGDRDGSHGRSETALAHESQTTIEPSVNHQSENTIFPDGKIATGDAGSRGSDSVPDCPHQTLIDLYAERLPQLPYPRIWEGQRQQNMRARWRWVLTAKKADGRRYATDTASAIAWFERFFAYVSESDFLTGRNGKWSSCDLGWLMKSENFAKVVQGNYVNREAA